MKRTFTYQDGKSDKFWTIEANGKSFTVTFGKTGTSGQAQTKDFDSDEKCQKEADKLIAEKTKKGYVEGAAVAVSGAAAKSSSSLKVLPLNEDNFLSMLQPIGRKEADKLYGVNASTGDYFNLDQEVDEDDEDSGESKWCVYKGDLHVKSIDTGAKADNSLFSLIVDGNLTVDEDISWNEECGKSFLIVTGNTKARNILLCGCPTIDLEGDVDVENGILGHHGDDGGELYARGKTKAKVIVNTLYFMMYFDSGKPDAIVIGDSFRTMCTVDFEDTFEFDEEDDEEMPLLPQLLYKEYWDEDGTLNSRAIDDALIAGKSIFKQDPKAAPDGAQKAVLGDRRILFATNSEDAAKVKELIEAGADLNPTNSHGLTALGVACRSNYPEIALLLIDAGADVHKMDKYDQSPLQLAAENGGLDVVKRLIAMGCPLNDKTNDGSTAIKWAAEHGHLEIVKMLFEAGADPLIKDDDDEDAIDFAKENKHKNIVTYLKEVTKKK